MNPPPSSDRQPRWLTKRLPRSGSRRLVVLTGARQTGKTTLARQIFGDDLRYLNLDDLSLRSDLEIVRAADWSRTIGPSILDEAQKAPSVFEKVKYAYDEGSLDFTVLLGSSRILLLDQVRETLAGRAFLYDLWPLMLSEIAAPGGSEPQRPLIGRLIEHGSTDCLESEPPILAGPEQAARLRAYDHLARWGGMPELIRLSEDDRRLWFRSYQQAHLERDLVDLVRLSDLRPFRKLQRLAMLRSGELINYASLGQDAQISSDTARRYLEYLHLTYQVVLLEPYHENLTSQVVKSPKLYWSDLGLLRGGTERWGALDGAQFETLVVAECKKWISTAFEPAKLFFYRTRSGLEVDLLLELSGGIIGIETKSREAARKGDRRGLRAIATKLGSRWLGGLVVHQGRSIQRLDEEHGIWGVPAYRLFT